MQQQVSGDAAHGSVPHPRESTNGSVPVTRATARAVQEAQEILDLASIIEPEGYKGAAERSRLDENKMSDLEFRSFPDVAQGPLNMYKDYLQIRNFILNGWFGNLNKELDLAAALRLEPLPQLEFYTDSDDWMEMAKRVHNFLDRNGFINYGVYPEQFKLYDVVGSTSTFTPTNTKVKRQKVIIIGAGLSGLTAARQLRRHGFQVVVFEARDRVGGRVATHRKGNFVADLGPMALNGIIGNPVVTIGRQIHLNVVELKGRIPIYEYKVETKHGQTVTSSHPLDESIEEPIEKEYTKIMDGTRMIKDTFGIETCRGQPLSVGQCVDWVISLQEKNIKEAQMKHLQCIERLHKMLIANADQKLVLAKKIKTYHDQLTQLAKESADDDGMRNDSVDLFEKRCVARDLSIAINEHKVLFEQEKEIEGKIDELMRNPPSDIYLSARDRRILDWHFAELEYALGSPLSELGLKYEEDEFIFPGSHWIMYNGFSAITNALQADIDVRLNTAIKSIHVTNDGVQVKTYNTKVGHQSQLVTHSADAVINTLPLGVLKHSMNPENKNTQNFVEFQPPLPRWKVASIERLGQGNLNKVILLFDKVFWNPDLHLFGHISPSTASRGEFFLFWHFTGTPILTALVAGNAANAIESSDDSVVLERVLTVLKSIYGVSNVPQPKEFVVTRWRNDPWSKGAWSFMQAGASGHDYEIMSLPVAYNKEQIDQPSKTINEEEAPSMEFDLLYGNLPDGPMPRLFFAGEHTTRNYFASTHGAILTGLREASRVANLFLGCNYCPKHDNRRDQVSSSAKS